MGLDTDFSGESSYGVNWTRQLCKLFFGDSGATSLWGLLKGDLLGDIQKTMP